MLKRDVIEDNLSPVSNAPVSHYTKMGTLCHLIPPGSTGWSSAWATPVQFLNDRAELKLGLEVLGAVAGRPMAASDKVRDVLRSLVRSSGRTATDAFQMSFSGNPDELGQWRGYGANGMGCSVVTIANAVEAVADVAGWVIYDTKKQQAFAKKIIARLNPEKDDDVIEQTLVAAACYMKHDAFDAEKEFRLLKFPKLEEIQFRETGDRLVPYVDFLQPGKMLPISKIIIGPGWQLAGLKTPEWSRNHVVQGIDRLLTARGMYAVGIEASRIPYDPK